MRVSVMTGLQLDIVSAQKALAALKSSSRVRFEIVGDDLGAAHLPNFVKTPSAITDGHLIELAKKHSLKVVTLDTGIPGALLIGSSQR